MLYELQQALGAPVAQGGVATYYDFYLDTSDGFYFDETGKYPDAGSRITIPANSETFKAKRICDMNPFRSEVWLWGAAGSGAIPLSMQPGYNTNKFSPPHTPDPEDPWSNDNTSDYSQHDNFTTVSYDTTTILPTGYALKFSQAAQPAQAPGWLHQGYWIMPFPFGSVGTDHYWPTTLNCYNETTMIETMGEITGLDFWLEGDHDFDIYIEAKDSQSTPVTGRSDTTYHYPTTDRAVLDYCEYSIPFGPSSNFIVPTTSALDWSSIQQIKFHFINGPDKAQTMYIHFDAFKMVKPLVAVATDYGAGLCTSDISNQTTVTDFKTAQAIAYGLLQNENTPQIYWDFENLGRTDIPVGRTFAMSGTPPLPSYA